MAWAMAAPVAAQGVMLAAMLAQRRWLFALMVGAGMLGCLAVPLASWLRRRQERSGGHGGRGHAVRSSGSDDDPPVAAGRDYGTGRQAMTMRRWEALPSAPLERLLTMEGRDAAEDMRDTPAVPADWRLVARLWLGPPSLRVPLGVGPEGVAMVDLAAQGPHALVAGTTGSGKSVLLQAWCLAMAARNPPEALNFVFLDFKGGAAFRPLERLPHTVGSVCDLDLKAATRALLALERELMRRERLVADAGVQRLDELADPPPRLVAVVDEFHALRGQLPDYVDRLTRIASLGRSLGMHVVACTQNPLGQVGPDMKANMSLNLCLRVRDTMQSAELLGDGAAASISPAAPGGLWCADGEGTRPWRGAHIRDLDGLVRAIALAARFHGCARRPLLFSAPLPADAGPAPAAGTGGVADVAGPPADIVFALGDDGIVTAPLRLPLDQGDVALVGPAGHGRTSLLRLVERETARLAGHEVHVVDRLAGRVRKVPVVPRGAAMADGPPAPPRVVWLADDADALLDPFDASALALRFREALADPAVTVVFAVASLRRLRVPEQCPVRIVFPCGDRTADQMAGVPAALWRTLDREDFETPGRVVLLRGAGATLAQCHHGAP